MQTLLWSFQKMIALCFTMSCRDDKLNVRESHFKIRPCRCLFVCLFFFYVKVFIRTRKPHAHYYGKYLTQDVDLECTKFWYLHCLNCNLNFMTVIFFLFFFVFLQFWTYLRPRMKQQNERQKWVSLDVSGICNCNYVYQSSPIERKVKNWIREKLHNLVLSNKYYLLTWLSAFRRTLFL